MIDCAKRNSIRPIWGTCKALTTNAVYQVKYTRQKYFAFIYSHSSATHELKWKTAMKRGMNQYAIWYWRKHILSSINVFVSKHIRGLSSFLLINKIVLIHFMLKAFVWHSNNWMIGSTSILKYVSWAVSNSFDEPKIRKSS